MSNILKINRDEVKLPFNPKTKKRTCQIVDLTPKIARYLLAWHNFDNRPLSKIQVKLIDKNIKEEGIRWDGCPLTFNVDGNMTEKQHFCTWLSTQPEDTVVQVVVITGVETDTFSKTAAAKPRTYTCEIQRKFGENLATKDKIAVLSDLISRSKEPNIKLNNGVRYWSEWCDEINIASKIAKDNYWDHVNKFAFTKKTIGSWTTFCVRHGLQDQCASVLKLLVGRINTLDSTRLADDAVTLWNSYASDLPNAKRGDLLFFILCAMLDCVKINPDGNCELGVRYDDLIARRTSPKGIAKKFMRS